MEAKVNQSQESQSRTEGSQKRMEHMRPVVGVNKTLSASGKRGVGGRVHDERGKRYKMGWYGTEIDTTKPTSLVNVQQSIRLN